MSGNIIQFPKSPRAVVPRDLAEEVGKDDIVHAIVAVIDTKGNTRVGVTSSSTAVVCYLLHMLRMNVDDLMRDDKT